MRKPNPPKLVTVVAITTITIVFWIFFTLYQVLTSKPDPVVSEALLEPINPTLNTSVLESLKDRVFFEEGSFNFEGPGGTNISSPEPTIESEVIPEAEVTETPTPEITEAVQ